MYVKCNYFSGVRSLNFFDVEWHTYCNLHSVTEIHYIVKKTKYAKK